MDNLEELEIPNGPSDAEGAMRDLIKPPAEENIETPPGDKPGDETPPDDTPPERPEGEGAPEVDAKAGTASELPDDDNYDAEIDAIELKPGASQKSQEALAILKQKAKDEHKAAKEAAKRAKELEQSQQAVDSRIKELEGKQLTPEIEQELTQLRQFRDTYGIEDDPGLSKPFDDRITAATSALDSVMKQIGVPDATIKFIQENVGLYSFRLSGNKMPSQVRNEDGSPMTHSQFYKRFIEGNLNEEQKEELQDNFAQIRAARREKAAAVDHLKNNRQEFLQRRQESIKAAQEDWVNRVTKHSEVVLKQLGDVATLKDIPANASPEEKARLEKHNENYRKAEAKAQQILSTVTPENLTEAAIAAGYVDILQESNKDLSKKLADTEKARDEIQKKYEDLKNAGKTADLRGTAETIKGASPKAKNAEDAMAALVGGGNQ